MSVYLVGQTKNASQADTHWEHTKAEYVLNEIALGIFNNIIFNGSWLTRQLRDPEVRSSNPGLEENSGMLLSF